MLELFSGRVETVFYVDNVKHKVVVLRNLTGTHL